MIFQESLDSLKNTQERVQKTITFIKEKKSDPLNQPSLKNILKAYENERKLEVELDSLLHYLDLQINDIYNDCKEFDELVAKTGLMSKNEKLTKVLVENGYCICNKPEDSDMIACDNKKCPIEWFHLDCVGLEQIPQGKWYCDSCQKK